MTMANFFNAHEKVSHLEMDELAIQIMYEFDDQSTQEELRSHMLYLMNSAKISPQSLCPQGKTLGFYLAREVSLPILLAYQSLGGDLTHCDTHGNTLMFEALSGFPIFFGQDYDCACIELLQQQGLDFVHTNKRGQTPIFGLRDVLNTPDMSRIFSTEGHEECFGKRVIEYIGFLRWAEQKGANLRHRDNDGHSVFDMAHGVEFTPLRNRLEIVRADLEKESILQNVLVTSTVSQRKM